MAQVTVKETISDNIKDAIDSQTSTGQRTINRRISADDMDQVLQRNFHHSDSELSALQQPQKYYPYEQLKTSNFKLPKGIDKTKLETYLSDQDFFDVFSMARVDFYTLPAWKQRDFKKKKLLF